MSCDSICSKLHVRQLSWTSDDVVSYAITLILYSCAQFNMPEQGDYLRLVGLYFTGLIGMSSYEKCPIKVALLLYIFS